MSKKLENKVKNTLDDLPKGSSQKELNAFLDNIIAEANESDSTFINLTREGAKFIIKNFDSTDRKTKKYETQIFTAEVLNEGNKTWEQKDFVCPKALITRFENLKRDLKNDFHDMIFLIKYNGLVQSTKSKNMIHSFFVKNLMNR